MRIEPQRLRSIRPKEIGIRFVLGAVASVVAGLVTLAAGPRAGGTFLAFPAILVAALTLVEQKEGTSEAVADVTGAILGALALIGCAASIAALARAIPVYAALLVGLGVWLLLAPALYATVPLAERALHAARYLPDVPLDEARRVVEEMRAAGVTLAVAERSPHSAVSSLLVGAGAGDELTSGTTLSSVERAMELAGIDACPDDGAAFALTLAETVRHRDGAELGLAVLTLRTPVKGELAWVASAPMGECRRLTATEVHDADGTPVVRAALELIGNAVKQAAGHSDAGSGRPLIARSPPRLSES